MPTWPSASWRKLYAQEGLGMDLNADAYALDSTTIELCLSLFPWAHFRPTDSAIKMHTLLDLRGYIPAFIRSTTALKDDVSIRDHIVCQSGAYYIVDRGYLDFDRFYRIHLAGAFFLTRAKRNLDARRVYSNSPDKQRGILADRTIALNRYRSHRDYPSHLRPLQMPLADRTVLQVHQAVRRGGRIKVFFGTSENAVKTQIWIAVSVYLLVPIVKKHLNLHASLYTLLQVLSVTWFEKMPIAQALQQNNYTNPNPIQPSQLILFDF
jgi:hypothetical protein